MDIDSKNDTLKKNRVYFHINTSKSPHGIDTTEFGWPKYNHLNYFVGFLVNTTDSTFRATKQDGSLIMIQEALDDKGVWKPIEYWLHSGCGNSYDISLELEPGKYTIIPIRKLTGDFKTKFRLKLEYGSDILYSDAYDGFLDLAIFEAAPKAVRGILYYGPPDYLND